MKEQCLNCKYFVVLEDEGVPTYNGQCHANPPVISDFALWAYFEARHMMYGTDRSRDAFWETTDWAFIDGELTKEPLETPLLHGLRPVVNEGDFCGHWKAKINANS